MGLGLVSGVLVLSAGGVIAYRHSHQSATVFHPDPQTQFAHCTVKGPLPDHDCTPGAVFTNVTVAQICVSGYSASVRNVPESEKKAVFAAYDIVSHPTGAFEVDHLISLELGGSNDLANLWPEAANPNPGFHDKDKLENRLHQLVCSGEMTLPEAQRDISGDWLRVYERLFGG